MITQIRFGKNDSNSYLLQQDGFVIIIDAGNGAEIIRTIREQGWTAEYIFLTHEHFDHIMDLQKLREEFDVPVVACRLCSERIQDVSTNLSNIADVMAYFKTGEIPEEKTETFDCEAAEIVYEDDWQFSWRGHEFAFRRLPGHSPASVVITMDGDKYFTGDYIIYQEEEILRLKDGSEADYEKYAKPFLDNIPEGAYIYPGHGEAYRK